MTKITKVPGVSERIETGPIQFGDDWPGVFIRGDHALADAMHLDAVLKSLSPDDWPTRAILSGLRDTLRSCHIENHRQK